MAETEQNKTEEPTPFKLKRSREKGMVARGVDLGFFSTLAALALFALLSGAKLGSALLATMERLLGDGIVAAAGNHANPTQFAALLSPTLMAAAPLGLAVLVVVAFEIIQIRGLIFTFQPLKPDFNRLNPGAGLKRVFSVRMLKETLKSILKLAVYSLVGYLLIVSTRDVFSDGAVNSADALARAANSAAMRLLFAFALVALVFALADQVLARADFLKRMRMSRGELTREHRDREGDHRIKQKRKQLHAEFAKQANAMRNLPGSDMLVVNPQHYAVALSYDAATMAAPKVTAKGRNKFALLMKKRAAVLSIPIYESPELARLLYREVEVDGETPPQAYRPLADLYIRLRRARADALAHA